MHVVHLHCMCASIAYDQHCLVRMWYQVFLFFSEMYFNCLPDVRIIALAKLKAFADDKINMTVKLKFVLGRVEHIVGKGENAGYQHFLLFPQLFQKASYPGSLKVGIVW